MKIKPFNTLIVVEKLEEEEKMVAGLYTPDSKATFFVKFKILGIGNLVELPLKEGMIIHAHDIMEPIKAGSKIGYINAAHVFGEVIE